MMQNSAFQIGNHVVHRDQPAWGVGRVVGLSKDGLRLAVRFSGRPREELQVATRDAALARYRFQPGDGVKLRGSAEKLVRGVVRQSEPGSLDTLTVEAEGKEVRVGEQSVASLPPASGVLESLVRGHWGD